MLVGYVVFQDDDQLSQRIPFYEGENLIGRNPAKANIPIKRRQISEQHAKLVVKESKVMLLDMGSKNGVYLNDLTNRLDRGTEVRLMPGMTFFISEVKCSIELIPKTLPTR